MKRAPFLLFVVSGFAALVLETVFLRQLTWVLGSSARALSIVLAAFLGGLALGAALFGRTADRVERPLVLFGLLEGGAGLTALALVWLLGDGRGALLAPLRAIDSAAARSIAEVVLALALLLVPTTLMGGTLPALGRYAIRALDSFVGSLGLLYGLNTLGAAAGTFVAGFLLFESLGVRGTAHVAIAAQLAIGLAAVLLGRNEAPPDAIERPSAPPRGTARGDGPPALALAIAVASGVAALGYEVAWTRLLSLPLRSFTYSFSLMLSLFLLGLCIGAVVLSAIGRRIARPLVWAGCLGLAMSGWVAASLIWLPGALAPLPIEGWGDFVVRGASRAAVVVLVPTILSGMILPLAARAFSREVARVGREVGAVWAANTAGSIAGALVSGLALLPALGAPRTLGVLAVGQAVASALVLAVPMRSVPLRAAALGATLLVALPVLAVDPARFVESFLAASRGTDTFGDLLFFRESATDTIAVVRREYGSKDPEAKSLLTNGVSMTATVKPVWRYMAAEGHLPVLLARDPSRALAVGVGTGITLAAVASHDEVLSITAVELSEGVIEALPVFEHENGRAFDDPRVRLVRQDGRHWLETARERFGVITVEPPPPIVAGAVHLYSREFYDACLAHLAPGGVVAQWLPLHAQSLASARMTARTFLDAFPHAQLWLPSVRDAILIGSPEALVLDPGRLGAAWTARRTRQNLDDAFFESPEALLATLLLDRAGIEAWVGDAPAITDDRPRMEFFRNQGGNMTDRDTATLLDPPQAGFDLVPEELRAAVEHENAVLRSYIRAAVQGDPRLHAAAARESRATEFFLYAFGCTSEQLARSPDPRCAGLRSSP